MKIAPDGTITVKKGFAWNYCSPQYQVFGVRIGAWNGRVNPQTGKVQTYAASLIHDVLYDDTRHGISRLKCDRVFLVLAKRDGFLLAELYFRLMRTPIGYLYWLKGKNGKT